MSTIEPLLLTLDQAADALSVSARTVRRLLDTGELTPVRIGRALRVNIASVHAYVDRATTVSNNHTGAGLASQTEKTACQSAKTKTGSTVVPIRRSGGSRIPTGAANELAARLGLTTEPKQK